MVLADPVAGPVAGRVAGLVAVLATLAGAAAAWADPSAGAAAGADPSAITPATCAPAATTAPCPPPAAAADQILSNETTFTTWAYALVTSPIRRNPGRSSPAVTGLHLSTEDGFPEVYMRNADIARLSRLVSIGTPLLVR